MPEEVSPTIEQKGDGADAARPGGNGTAVDQSSQTLKGGALPHSDASPPGNALPTFASTAADTKPLAGPSDVTMAGPAEGITLIAPPFQGSVDSPASDATLNSAPHDATLGG